MAISSPTLGGFIKKMRSEGLPKGLPLSFDSAASMAQMYDAPVADSLLSLKTNLARFKTATLSTENINLVDLKFIFDRTIDSIENTADLAQKAGFLNFQLGGSAKKMAKSLDEKAEKSFGERLADSLKNGVSDVKISLDDADSNPALNQLDGFKDFLQESTRQIEFLESSISTMIQRNVGDSTPEVAAASKFKPQPGFGMS